MLSITDEQASRREHADGEPEILLRLTSRYCLGGLLSYAEVTLHSNEPCVVSFRQGNATLHEFVTQAHVFNQYALWGDGLIYVARSDLFLTLYPAGGTCPLGMVRASTPFGVAIQHPQYPSRQPVLQEEEGAFYAPFILWPNSEMRVTRGCSGAWTHLLQEPLTRD